MQRREPIGEIEDHAGEKAGLGEAEGKPQNEEADRPPGEREGGRNQAPADHDAANPAARPDLIENQIARHLENEIAQKKAPAPSPKIYELSPRSLFMVSAANPIFTRSR